jgi:biopolymer transport protein ExbB
LVRHFIKFALPLLLVLVVARVAFAQQGPQAAPAGEAPPAEDSLAEIVFSGGPIGIAIVVTLFALSLGGMALVIEHVMTIRRSVLMPDELVKQLRESLAQGQVGQAIQRCDATPCAFASMMRAALVEAEAGWPAVEKGLEEQTAEEASRLFRKIEYLSLLGNIAPMVGLLGTVVGMLLAFREVANTQGAARAAELASGIYQALVTTVCGLIIAIPALAAYAMFRNRVDGLIAECVSTAKGLLVPIRRALTNRKTP